MAARAVSSAHTGPGLHAVAAVSSPARPPRFAGGSRGTGMKPKAGVALTVTALDCPTAIAVSSWSFLVRGA